MKLKKIKHKKGISPMIGYVLLISVAIFMSAIVYSWLKTYVPKDAIECPDTTSLFVKNYTCDLNELNITIKNNGNFNIAGYFIRAANNSEQKVATIDLSSKLKENFGGMIFGSSILFKESKPGNSLIPEQESTNVFDVSGIGTIYFIEITPIRIQDDEGKIRTASCGNSKIREQLNC